HELLDVAHAEAASGVRLDDAAAVGRGQIRSAVEVHYRDVAAGTAVIRGHFAFGCGDAGLWRGQLAALLLDLLALQFLLFALNSLGFAIRVGWSLRARGAGYGRERDHSCERSKEVRGSCC